MKCAACCDNKCSGNYEKRDACEDPENCTCTCQESSGTTAWKMVGSIAGGLVMFGGGVALTVMTGGVGGVAWASAAVGGALTGAGASSVINPISKKIGGERMTGGDYCTDVGIGAATGLITGPLSFGAGKATESAVSGIAKESCKRGAAKMACRVGAGAATGAVESVIQESYDAVANENKTFNVNEVMKGALLGSVTGGAGHLSKNLANKAVIASGGAFSVVESKCTIEGVTKKIADPGVARSAAKVAADGVTVTAVVVGEQLAVDGKVDGNCLAVKAGLKVGFKTYECGAKNGTYRVRRLN